MFDIYYIYSVLRCSNSIFKEQFLNIFIKSGNHYLIFLLKKYNAEKSI